MKPLAEATGVWFANGHTDRLVNAYRGTLFEKELKKLHARGGAIGGTGGGSSVMGGLVFAGGEEKPTVGFGLLPGFVIERKDMLEGAVTDNPGYVGLRLPDGAAVVVQGRRARVIGRARCRDRLPGEGGRQAGRGDSTTPGRCSTSFSSAGPPRTAPRRIAVPAREAARSRSSRRGRS